MMTFLTLIIYLAGFAFGILGIIGLFSPAKGGFWMKFLKTPKRLPVFGLNFIAFVLLLVAGGQIVMSDNYGYGISSLESKNFNSAITSFEKLKKSDKHFSEKEQLIQSVYDSAKEHYSAQINSLIADIDQDAAINSNNEYKELTGELLFPESNIDDEISKNINAIKIQVSEFMKLQSYEDALKAVDRLAKIDSLKDYIAGIHGNVRDIQLKAVKAQIEGYIQEENYIEAIKIVNTLIDDDYTKNYSTDILERIRVLQFEDTKKQIENYIQEGNYIEAQYLVDPLSKNDKTKSYASEITKNISDLLRLQLKEKINDDLSNRDFESVNKNLNILKKLGSEETFITSINDKMAKLENERKIKNIEEGVYESINEAEFTNARIKVQTLKLVHAEEEHIIYLNQIIDEQETKYLEEEAARLAQKVVNSSIEVQYGDILRNPDSYQGKIIEFYGAIKSKLNSNTYQLSTKNMSGIGYFGDDVIFKYEEPGVIIGDVVIVYGNFTGLGSYTTGELPEINAKVIDIRFTR